MAKQIIQNPSITLNGTAMHANVTQVTISLTAEDVDQTNFGSLGWKERTGGLKDGSISFEFQNDYAAAALDSQMFPLLGTSIAFDIRPASTAIVSSSNPKYTGTLLVAEYSPVDSAVGDLATFSVTYPVVGVVTRGTA
jgi:predicted secreted protein